MIIAIKCDLANENRPYARMELLVSCYSPYLALFLVLVALQSVLLFLSYKGKRVDHLQTK